MNNETEERLYQKKYTHVNSVELNSPIHPMPP